MTRTNPPVPRDAMTTPARRPAVNTAWIWLIVFGPLAWAAVLWIPDMVQPPSEPGSEIPESYVQWIKVSAVALVVAGAMLAGLGVVCACRDWVHLRATVTERPFGWAWQFAALAGLPVYAIGRAVVVHRRTGRGMAIIPTSIIIALLAPINALVWVVYNFISISLLMTGILFAPVFAIQDLMRG